MKPQHKVQVALGVVWVLAVVGAIVAYDRHHLGEGATWGVVIAVTLFAFVTSNQVPS